MRASRLLPVGLAFATLAACSDSPTAPAPPTVVDLSAEWTTATPASHGIDAARLDAAVAHAGTLPRLLSLLVVRHGRLVSENYFNGNTAETLNDVRSITKSVMSTLVGIAIERGDLQLDGRIVDHLPEWSAELTGAERQITVRHLLTMTGGWTWNESGTSAYNDWILSGDHVGFLLRRPHGNTPGQSFIYDSPAVHLLGIVMANAVGRPLPSYADEHLFAPLGITNVRWESLSGGQVNGGAGIDLRPRDLARFGALWLQRGDVGNRRVLDARWISDATQPAFAWWRANPPLGDQNYGRLWWLSRSPGPSAFFAWGHGGQFIWVSPAHDAVVVVTHDWRRAGSQAGQLAVNGLDLIINRVLPAMR